MEFLSLPKSESSVACLSGSKISLLGVFELIQLEVASHPGLTLQITLLVGGGPFGDRRPASGVHNMPLGHFLVPFVPISLGTKADFNRIVLLANGLSFAVQVVLFLIVGSFANYGTW